MADRIVRIRDGRLSEEWTRERAELGHDRRRPGRLAPPARGAASARGHRRASLGEARHGRDRRLAGRIVGCGAAAPEPVRRRGAGGAREASEVVASRTRHRQGLRRDAACSTASTPTSSAGASTRSPVPRALARPPSCTSSPGSSYREAGEIEVDGALLTGLDRTARAAHRRASIAYVGQQAGLVGAPLGARERRARPHAPRRRRSPSCGVRGARGGRPCRAHGQRVSRLSHGERARVAIARAVASRPKLLLADEPTSRLDGANALAVALLLGRLARDTGAAVVCATHDPLVIEQADDELRLT